MKPMLALLILSAAAHAQPADVTQTTSAHDDPTVAVTLSPFHMFVPMAELTAELKLAPKLGVSLIGGVGVLRDETTNDRITLLEAGASARYYLTGSFRTGIQLGAEAIYVHASTEMTALEVKARGLAVSPFAGYKWTHHSGFTLEGQLGVSLMAARADSATATATASRVGPMLNLNVGWSF